MTWSHMTTAQAVALRALFAQLGTPRHRQYWRSAQTHDNDYTCEVFDPTEAEITTIAALMKLPPQEEALMTEPLRDPNPRLAVLPSVIGMTLHATGPEAEAEVRRLCSGYLPRVGERYVWVCTAVQTSGEGIRVQFSLMPLEEERP
jgi:hypothetical protein